MARQAPIQATQLQPSLDIQSVRMFSQNLTKHPEVCPQHEAGLCGCNMLSVSCKKKKRLFALFLLSMLTVKLLFYLSFSYLCFILIKLISFRIFTFSSNCGEKF